MLLKAIHLVSKRCHFLTIVHKFVYWLFNFVLRCLSLWRL